MYVCYFQYKVIVNPRDRPYRILYRQHNTVMLSVMISCLEYHHGEYIRSINFTGFTPLHVSL